MLIKINVYVIVQGNVDEEEEDHSRGLCETKRGEKTKDNRRRRRRRRMV